MYKHILLPTDGSDLSKVALKHGIAFAKSVGAEVTAMVVLTPLRSLVVDPNAVAKALEHYKALVAEQTTRYLEHVRKDAEEAGVSCNVLCVEHDKPYEAIVDTARHSGCDLILMASHGLRGVQALLGSETLKVLTNSSMPVLVYR